MTEFVLKSSLSLSFLYLLYFLLLRNMKSFQFNRFFILFAVFFSIAIPFLHIKTNIQLPINSAIQESSVPIGDTQTQDFFAVDQNVEIVNVQNILLLIYLLVFTILLVRFVFNLIKLTRTIKRSERVLGTMPKIVLAPEKTLPYSFLNCIIVNKTDYETGKIDNALITHERTHCLQNHSIDILLIEIIKIVLWYNPFLWILKKEIQLVHEYIADNEALENQNIKSYQNALLNLVFRNNSTYLASNFNYSLTKKRLLMMTKNNSKKKTMVRKIAIIPPLFLLIVSLTLCQKEILNEKTTNNEDEWWYPILEKHNIELLAHNNYQDIFEMGTSNSINNGIVTLTDALIIIREDDTYKIVRSSLAHHNLDKNEISAGEGTMELFSFESNDSQPTSRLFFKNFIFFKSNEKNLLKVEDVKGTVSMGK